MTMLDDFETMEVYDLCEKYGEYIDNRYYMHREEHGFEMPEDVFPGDGAKPYVEKVVRILKSKYKNITKACIYESQLPCWKSYIHAFML